jgi:hypothetical protein
MLVKNAAHRAGDAIGQTQPISAFRNVLRELRDRRVRIPERQLARAVLRAGTVATASVRTRPGRIEIEAELESGRAVHIALLPLGAHFAPRGAKEIVFAVDPADAVNDTKVRDIVGMIAAQVARAIWGPFLPVAEGAVDNAALVDREKDHLRVDLRTCPAVLGAIKGMPALSLVMDALRIERMDVDEHGLSVRIALPELTAG